MDCLSVWLIGWFPDWLTDWLSVWLIDQLINCEDIQRVFVMGLDMQMCHSLTHLALTEISSSAQTRTVCMIWKWLSLLLPKDSRVVHSLMHPSERTLGTKLSSSCSLQKHQPWLLIYLGHVFVLQVCWSQFKFPVTWQRKNFASELCHSVAHGILSIAGLHVMSLWPCWWCVRVKEQKHFSPLGTKPYFHVNSSRKKSYFIDHQHGHLVAWLQAKNTPNLAVSDRGSFTKESKYGLQSSKKSPSKVFYVYQDPLGTYSWASLY